MKLIHLGHYAADYPSLGLADVAPAGEVEISDPDTAAAVMVEGIFGPGDTESKKLLIDTLTADEVARIAQEAAQAAQADADAKAAEDEAAQATQEQEARRDAVLAEIEAARRAAVKAAVKPAGKAGE